MGDYPIALHKIQTFASTDLNHVQSQVNQWLKENRLQIRDVQIELSTVAWKDSLSGILVMYTILIHYTFAG